MSTIMQLCLKARKLKKSKNKTPALQGNPQKKGVCVKILNRTPKKPNSALRKIAKFKLNKEHNLKISENTIKKIWSNSY